MPLLLPDEVVATLRELRTCELTTIGRDGYPSTWPTSVNDQPDTGRFVLTTSIAFPQKALNIRRNPRVSMLHSDPTASGLDRAPLPPARRATLEPARVRRSGRPRARRYRVGHAPTRLLDGQGAGGVLGQRAAIPRFRKTAAGYLAKRGLARPKVDWDSINRLRDEANAMERGR